MGRYTRQTDADIERQQIEHVFMLTGGELETEPWEHTCDRCPCRARYWYEGIPDYCERSERRAWEDTQARTIIVFGGGYLSAADEWLIDEQGAWRLVATYTSSGETECPYRHDPETRKVERSHCRLVPSPWVRHDGPTIDRPGHRRAECPLCEERIGSDHGYIYVGDGYEAIYSLEEQSTHTREDYAPCHACGVLTYKEELTTRYAYDDADESDVDVSELCPNCDKD